MNYRDYEKMYETAETENNTKLLDYFAKYGDKSHCIYNICRFENSRACGFTDPFHVDESGWCDNGNITVEKIPILIGRYTIEIHLAQLPNKNWVGGSTVLLDNCGYGASPSIFSTQISSREEVVLKELDEIESFIIGNSQHAGQFLKYVTDYRKMVNDKQMSLF